MADSTNWGVKDFQSDFYTIRDWTFSLDCFCGFCLSTWIISWVDESSACIVYNVYSWWGYWITNQIITTRVVICDMIQPYWSWNSCRLSFIFSRFHTFIWNEWHKKKIQPNKIVGESTFIIPALVAYLHNFSSCDRGSPN
jgi:hypothetical protein